MEKQNEGVEVVEDGSDTLLRKTDAALFALPWKNLGNYKYLLYGPFLAKLIHSMHWKESMEDIWCLNILVLCALRGLVHQLWSTYSNTLYLNRTRRVSQQGIDYEQIDNESDWDNFLILQAIVGSFVYLNFPALANLPLWDVRGLISCLILHIGISEPLLYWMHRLLHSPHLFPLYHWHHHEFKITKLGMQHFWNIFCYVW